MHVPGLLLFVSPRATNVWKSVNWMCVPSSASRTCVGIHIWQFTVVHRTGLAEYERLAMLFHSILFICILWRMAGDASSRCWTTNQKSHPPGPRESYKRSNQQKQQHAGNLHCHKTAIIIVAGAHFAHNGIQIWTINLATQINLL